jgi:hypothetical protein
VCLVGWVKDPKAPKSKEVGKDGFCLAETALRTEGIK